MANYFESSAALKLKPFSSRVATIISELSDRRVLEEEFLLDPSGYLASKLHSDVSARIPRQQLNSANRFLFSIMSNKSFRDWITDYHEKFLLSLEADPLTIIDKDKVRADLARAMMEFGDPAIINAILPGTLNASSEHHQNDAVDRRIWIVDVAVEIEAVIYAIAVAGVFALVVAIPAIGAAPRVNNVPGLRDTFVGSREMSSIADALVRVGNDLRSRGHL